MFLYVKDEEPRSKVEPDTGVISPVLIKLPVTLAVPLKD